MTGDLTLLGTARPAVLDVQGGTVGGSHAEAHASITIDRRDFRMTYAGFAIGKEVSIAMDVEENAGTPPM